MHLEVEESVKRFLKNLEGQAAGNATKAIDLLETYGHMLHMPFSKKVAPKLYELRIRGKQEIRVFYSFHNNIIWLFHAFIKKSNKIPTKELRLAKLKQKRLTKYN